MYIFYVGCDRDTGGQRVQHRPVVPPAGRGPRVQDGDRTAVGLGADGAAEALPQFLLHFGHNFGLYVGVQIGVLFPPGLPYRVGDRKRQPHDHQQRDPVPGEIYAFPAGAARQQYGVGALFELLHKPLPAARGLEQRHRQPAFQLFIHMAHLVIRGEQHQRVPVGGTDELPDLAGHTLVGSLFLLPARRWRREYQQAVVRVIKRRRHLQSTHGHAAVQTQLTPRRGEVDAGRQRTGSQDGRFFLPPQQIVELAGQVARYSAKRQMRKTGQRFYAAVLYIADRSVIRPGESGGTGAHFLQLMQ